MKALLIVDMLNDFVQQDGYSAKLPVAGADKLIENIAALKARAEAAGVPVAYDNDAHAPDDAEFRLWPEHCVKCTYGANVVAQLAPSDGNLIFEKQDLSVFTNAEFDRIMRSHGVDELLIAGVATEYCVMKAALDALKRSYKVSIVVDAIAGVDLQKGDQARALVEMGNAGARPVYTKMALEGMLDA